MDIRSRIGASEMRLEIKDTLTSTALSRDLYVFDFNTTHGFRLVSYHQQTRASNRHKWTGPFWDSSDERDYHSKLKRPTTIPAHVIEDARRELNSAIYKLPIFIGWWNADHKL
jgi:hypothetical protein